MFDQLKEAAGKAAELAGQHADKIEPLIDKAGDLIDGQTDGKFADAVDKVQDAAKNALHEQARQHG
ncbi:antitoxin [Nocardia yunnanensis]|uniref:Antitoxin n=1 Tax=Nocardia yunnanensis TaxID=2382165 RepID=A0A386ZPY4_9NOCA|nr:antitoxin [Nocardia yunnanensis]AYF78769.1 antitoxin [Nocardia yunnanensis]